MTPPCSPHALASSRALEPQYTQPRLKSAHDKLQMQSLILQIPALRLHIFELIAPEHFSLGMQGYDDPPRRAPAQAEADADQGGRVQSQVRSRPGVVPAPAN